MASPVIRIQPGFCDTCKRETALRCSDCQFAYYCSVACQLSKREDHRPFCKAVKGTIYRESVEDPFELAQQFDDQQEIYQEIYLTNPQQAFNLGLELLEKLMTQIELNKRDITLRKARVLTQEVFLFAMRETHDPKLATEQAKLQAMIQDLRERQENMTSFTNALSLLQKTQELLRLMLEKEALQEYAATPPNKPEQKKDESSVKAKPVVTPPHPLQAKFDQLSDEHEELSNTLATEVENHKNNPKNCKRKARIGELKLKVTAFAGRVGDLKAEALKGGVVLKRTPKPSNPDKN